jgi:hypothetical protein
VTFIPRLGVTGGWTPDADASRVGAGAFVRMDNLTLDQTGVLALRLGSLVLNSFGATIDSLYTEVLSGVRYRFTAAGNLVYVNGQPLPYTHAAAPSGGDTPNIGAPGDDTLPPLFEGEGDVAFGGHLGQVLMARGSTRVKFDGETVRNWGVPMTGTAPTATETGTPDGHTLETGATGESPALVVNEDNGGGLTHANDHAGNANGAAVISTSAASGRAVVTKTFSTPQDLTTYDGGTAANDNDLFGIYFSTTTPENLISVQVQVDVNDGTFQTDYYAAVFPASLLTGDPPPDGGTSPEPPLPASLRLQGPDRARVQAALQPRHGGQPAGSVVKARGFTLLSMLRGSMQRTGATSGADWSTVKAVRVIITATSVLAGTFDTIRLTSSVVLGQYTWLYVLAYNSGDYVGLSAPSAASAPLSIQSSSVNVTIPADPNRDPQATDVWVYRFGGVMDGYYRTAAMPIAGTDALVVPDTMTDIDAMALNLPLQTDNLRPPLNIIDIEGPYYDRTFALTSDGFLWPSRQLNPDSFSAGQALRVAAPEETAYWVKRAFGGLYIGTSKDIYRLSGTGAEFPDGSIDFTKQPLNVDHPPVNDAVAQEGNLLVYVAADGWRAFVGEATQTLTGNTSLLYRGYTRHGVSPVNLETGRFRATITKGQLVATTPEGDSTASSPVVYRQVPSVGSWYRHTYPYDLTFVYREPDGTLLAGDSVGRVWQLDVGTADAGATIPVVLRTGADDFGAAFGQKEMSDVHLIVDTAGVRALVRCFLDGSDTPGPTLYATTTGFNLAIVDAHLLGRVRQLQLEIAGSFPSFRFGGYGFTLLARPTGVCSWDSGPIDVGPLEMTWLRHLFLSLNASAPDLAITVYMDGKQMAQTLSVVPTLNADVVIPVDIGRGVVGRRLRLVVNSGGPFLPYWIEVVARNTGSTFAKARQRIPVGV